MTDTIDRLAVGPELDAEIGRRVFGLKPFAPKGMAVGWMYYIPSGKSPRTHMIDAIPLPAYSTDIAAAWPFVEGWVAEGYLVNISSDHATDGDWEIELGVQSTADYDRGLRGMFGGGCATLAEAIARTALGHAEMLVAGESGS